MQGLLVNRHAVAATVQVTVPAPGTAVSRLDRDVEHGPPAFVGAARAWAPDRAAAGDRCY